MESALNKNLILVIVAAAILTLALLLFSQLTLYFLALVIFALLVILFIKKPEYGIYIIAFIFPFNYWQLVFGSLNAPYVDLLGIVVLVAWSLKALYFYVTKNQKLDIKNFPGWLFMFLFVATAFLSLLNVDREFFSLALKYVFRPIIFFYLIYVILPVNIITKIKQLFTVFKIMFVLGISLSFMGVWSLVFEASSTFRRVAPISIFNIYPIGYNHNALSEMFVFIIPIALVLFWYEKDILLKNFYLLGAFLMGFVNLLTFSRSGWIALAVMLGLLLLFEYRDKIKNIFTSYILYLIIVLLAPLIYLMYRFFDTHIVAGSNASRMKLIETAWVLFWENPIIGKGAGTFVYYLSNMQWYLIEYGTPLEAHGFLFKTMAELGILGTLAFLGLLGYILFVTFKVYQNNRQTKLANLHLAMFLMVVGGVIFQLFSTSYYVANFWFPIGVVLASLKFSDYKII